MNRKLNTQSYFAFSGEVRRKNMLDKYDEEIDGAKMDAFTIGNKGEYNEEEEIKKQKESIKVTIGLLKTFIRGEEV